MKSVSGRRLARAVEGQGVGPVARAGKPHIYGKEGSTIRLSIPMHEGRDLKVGLLKHLMKLAGVEESDL